MSGIVMALSPKI